MTDTKKIDIVISANLYETYPLEHKNYGTRLVEENTYNYYLFTK
jgi:hypothetical protein